MHVLVGSRASFRNRYRLIKGLIGKLLWSCFILFRMPKRALLPPANYPGWLQIDTLVRRLRRSGLRFEGLLDLALLSLRRSSNTVELQLA